MIQIYQGLLTCVCITIPEFMFMIIITLRLMGRKEMLDLYNFKENLISILKIVIPPALILNFMSFIINISIINRLTPYIILYLLLIYILKKESLLEYPKLYQKAFIFLIISILIAIAIEIITLPIIFKLINKTYLEIKQNYYLVIICSLSSRIVDIVILFCIYLKKNSKFQINIIDYIFNNKFYTRVIIIIIIGLVISEAYFIKLILWNNFLGIIPSIDEQLFSVIGFTFLVPGFIISIIYSFINYCVMIVNSEKQSVRND